MGGVADTLNKMNPVFKATLGKDGLGIGADGPEVPDAPTPDAPVQKGEEGIRRGEAMRQSKRRALGQAYLTKGQGRSSGGTLGGTANTLG